MWLKNYVANLIGKGGSDGKKIALSKYRGVVSLGNLDHQRFVDAFCLEVFREALAQQGGMDPDDIVGSCVVVLWPTEDLISQFKFVNVFD